MVSGCDPKHMVSSRGSGVGDGRLAGMGNVTEGDCVLVGVVVNVEICSGVDRYWLVGVVVEVEIRSAVSER